MPRPQAVPPTDSGPITPSKVSHPQPSLDRSLWLPLTTKACAGTTGPAIPSEFHRQPCCCPVPGFLGYSAKPSKTFLLYPSQHHSTLLCHPGLGPTPVLGCCPHQWGICCVCRAAPGGGVYDQSTGAFCSSKHQPQLRLLPSPALVSSGEVGQLLAAGGQQKLRPWTVSSAVAACPGPSILRALPCVSGQKGDRLPLWRHTLWQPHVHSESSRNFGQLCSSGDLGGH